MNEQIIRFLKRIDEDPAVRREVEAVTGGSRCAGDVTDIAQAHGYDFSLEEFLAALELLKAPAETAEREGPLDDADLEGVAGGSHGLAAFGDYAAVVALGRSIAGAVSCCGECLEARRA